MGRLLNYALAASLLALALLLLVPLVLELTHEAEPEFRLIKLIVLEPVDKTEDIHMLVEEKEIALPVVLMVEGQRVVFSDNDAAKQLPSSINDLQFTFRGSSRVPVKNAQEIILVGDVKDEPAVIAFTVHYIAVDRLDAPRRTQTVTGAHVRSLLDTAQWFSPDAPGATQANLLDAAPIPLPPTLTIDILMTRYLNDPEWSDLEYLPS